MDILRSRSWVRTSGAAAALLAVLCGAVAAETKPPYLARGDAVEARYRGLGADGYEVTESIADPNDIMGAPGFGPVLRAHFDALLRARRP